MTKRQMKTKRFYDDRGRLFEARPATDVENDGHDCPSWCRWVLFIVLQDSDGTEKVDACGYCKSLAAAKRLETCD